MTLYIIGIISSVLRNNLFLFRVTQRRNAYVDFSTISDYQPNVRNVDSSHLTLQQCQISSHLHSHRDNPWLPGFTYGLNLRHVLTQFDKHYTTRIRFSDTSAIILVAFLFFSLWKILIWDGLFVTTCGGPLDIF